MLTKPNNASIAEISTLPVVTAIAAFSPIMRWPRPPTIEAKSGNRTSTKYICAGIWLAFHQVRVFNFDATAVTEQHRYNR